MLCENRCGHSFALFFLCIFHSCHLDFLLFFFLILSLSFCFFLTLVINVLVVFVPVLVPCLSLFTYPHVLAPHHIPPHLCRSIRCCFASLLGFAWAARPSIWPATAACTRSPCAASQWKEYVVRGCRWMPWMPGLGCDMSVLRVSMCNFGIYCVINLCVMVW